MHRGPDRLIYIPYHDVHRQIQTKTWNQSWPGKSAFSTGRIPLCAKQIETMKIKLRFIYRFTFYKGLVLSDRNKLTSNQFALNEVIIIFWAIKHEFNYSKPPKFISKYA